ncbi:MAG: DUF4157 domain-containing protein [Chlorobiales bacterium]|nr:DUF4157 domain-containing protein [Chlorobiales bacterium]
MKTAEKSTTVTQPSIHRKDNKPFFSKPGRDSFFTPARTAIQAKLTIGETGDKYEKEADTVSDMVMRMPSSSANGETLLRQEEEKLQMQEEDEKEDWIQTSELEGNERILQQEDEIAQRYRAEEEQLQRKGNGIPTVTPGTQAAIYAQTTKGDALPSDVRSFMEPRLNADFSNVRIHSDREAASLNNQLSARAFTYRNHIFFSRDQYQPGTSEGKHLLAHELTHTIQQKQSYQRAQPGALEQQIIQRFPENTQSAPVNQQNSGASAPSAPPAGHQEGQTAAPQSGSVSSEAAQTASSTQNSAASGSVSETSATTGGQENLVTELPGELSSEENDRLAEIEHQISEAGDAQEELPSAEENVIEAREAVEEPAEETSGRAGGNVASELGATSPPSPEVEALCRRIRTLIANRQPPSEAAVLESNPAEEAQAAGDAVQESVEGEVEETRSSYDRLEEEPEGEPGREPGDIETPPEQVSAPEINAEAATPDPVSSEEVSLDADVEAGQASIDEAGMNSEPAQLVENGPIAEAREAQGELAETAQRAPQEVLAEHQEAREQARADLAALRNRAVAAMQESRSEAIAGTIQQQQAGRLDEETQRRQAGQRAQQIFESAQNRVNAQLEELPQTAMSLWRQGVQVLSTEYDQAIERIQRRLEERYEGVTGAVLELAESVIGKPDWVTEGYNAAEHRFGEGACRLLRSISREVNTVIDSCQAIIDDATTQIDNLFASLPENLQAWAQGQRAEYAERLDGLHHRVMTAQADLTRDLVQTAGQAVQEMRERTQELRNEARGLVGRIEDAVNAFIENPARFIIEGLLELVGIPPASFWALIDRIGQVINDIADDPMNFANNIGRALGQGFQQFFDNFKDHILSGFFEWLFSGLGSVGVQLPSDFSLGSLITFFLQLMGITWNRIRQILARHIGEQNVALIEKAYELISMLIERGPEGIFEMIREQLDPQTILSAILDAAVDFLIEALIRAVTPRIIGLFNPAGAIVQAIEVIYRILAWIFNNAARIFSLVETVVNGAADLIAGNIGGMASAIEGALARLISPVIDFLAGFLGLGNLPDRIADTIRSFQEMVLRIIDRVIAWLAERARGLLRSLGIGADADEVNEDDPEKADRVRAGLAAIDSEEARLVENGKISREDAEQVARRVKQSHPVFTRLNVVDGGDSWDYRWEASPGDTKVTPLLKEEGTLYGSPEEFTSESVWEDAARRVGATEGAKVTRLSDRSASYCKNVMREFIYRSGVNNGAMIVNKITEKIDAALEATDGDTIYNRLKDAQRIVNRLFSEKVVELHVHHEERVKDYPATFPRTRLQRIRSRIARRIKNDAKNLSAEEIAIAKIDDTNQRRLMIRELSKRELEKDIENNPEVLDEVEMDVMTREAHLGSVHRIR